MVLVRYSDSTSYFKNTAVQNVNKPFVYITDLTSTLIKSKNFRAT